MLDQLQLYSEPSCSVALENYLGQPSDDYDPRFNTLLLTFRVRLGLPSSSAAVYYRRKFSEPLAVVTQPCHEPAARSKLSLMLDSVRVPHSRAGSDSGLVGEILDGVRRIVADVEDPPPALRVQVKIDAVVLRLPPSWESERDRYDDGPPIYLNHSDSRDYQKYNDGDEPVDFDWATFVEDLLAMDNDDNNDDFDWAALMEDLFAVDNDEPKDNAGDLDHAFDSPEFAERDDGDNGDENTHLVGLLDHRDELVDLDHDFNSEAFFENLFVPNHDDGIMDDDESILDDDDYDDDDELALDDTLMEMVTAMTGLETEPSFVAASRESILGLERVRVLNKSIECTVCLDRITVGSEVTQLPCSHCFHGHCIVRWLETSKFCPLCRFELQ